MHFINRSAWKPSQHYETVLNIITATMLAPSTPVLFTTNTYIYLCFIKVIAFAPVSVCFSIMPPHVRLVLVCVCVFLAIAMHACVYCVACGSEDVIQYYRPCFTTKSHIVNATQGRNTRKLHHIHEKKWKRKAGRRAAFLAKFCRFPRNSRRRGLFARGAKQLRHGLTGAKSCTGPAAIGGIFEADVTKAATKLKLWNSHLILKKNAKMTGVHASSWVNTKTEQFGLAFWLL